MRNRWIIVIVIAAVIVAYWWLRPRPKNLPQAYLSERSATLWSSTAEVRQQLAALRYGEKLIVLQQQGDYARVRTTEGVTGWLEARMLMDSALWQKAEQLAAQARSMPVQARGHTKVISNVRLEPGRAAPRIYQFGRDTPVGVLARATAEWSPSNEEGQAPREPGREEEKPRREDWFLVRGPLAAGRVQAAGEESSAQGAVSGWVLARFIELDLAEPLPAYTLATGMRVVAWFELDRVPDASGDKPQYLAAGVRGPEGQACDFTMIRVFTWGSKRQRYETAYIESDFCGYLPIRVGKTSSGDPEFRFAGLGKEGKVERVYSMRRSVVRRVRERDHPARPRR